MKKVLTIAGSDSSGGAGIQADLKTICAHGCYGMSVITAITAQNTLGVYGIMDVDINIINSQIDAVCNDIFPDSIKIGMVSKTETILAIAKKLIEHNCTNIVLDPVMISTSGHKLLDDDAILALKTKLMPLATIITPNIAEACVLANMDICNKQNMVDACKTISKFYDGNILLKGGHLQDNCDDLLYKNGKEKWFEGKKIDTKNTHGTGCTLSSAIACNLAKGLDIEKNIFESKKYVTNAIINNSNLGNGSGPLNHMWNIK